MFSKINSKAILAKASWLIALSLVVGTFNFSVPSAKAITGTPISSCHELYDALTAEGGLAEDYVIAVDLDCTDAGLLAENPETTLEGNDFMFPGEFAGTLDGHGNTLALEFSADNQTDIQGIGLFAEASQASVTDFDVDISINIAINGGGSIQDIGGLIARGDNLMISNIYGEVDIDIHEGEGYNAATTTIQLVGGLLGVCTGTCQLSAVQLTSDITSDLSVESAGSNYFGGVVGYFVGGVEGFEAEDIQVEANVRAPFSTDVGGFAGRLANSTMVRKVIVTRLGEAGKVLGSDFVGGVAGYLGSFATLRDSYARIDAEGVDSIEGVGGLVGKSDGNIYTSFSTGDVASDGVDVGGLVGSSTGEIESAFSAAGSVTADGTHGSFIGWNNNGFIRNSAVVTIADTNAVGFDQLGGGTVALLATYHGSNFDLATEGGINALKAEPTHDVYTGDDAVYEVWDFDDIWAFDEGVNDDFPVLQITGVLPYSPIITTAEAINVGLELATIGGRVYGWGSFDGSDSTVVGVRYGTESVEPETWAELADYDTDASTEWGGELGSEPGAFTFEIAGLQCNTVYYYVAYARDVESEDAYADLGEEASFTTLACPVSHKRDSSTLTNEEETAPSTFQQLPDSMVYEFVSQNGTDTGAAHEIEAKAGDTVTLSLTVRNRSQNPAGLVWYGLDDLLPENVPHQYGHAIGVGTTNPFDKPIAWLTSDSFFLNGNRFGYYNGTPVFWGGTLTMNWQVKLKSDLAPGKYRLDAGFVREHDGWGKQEKNGLILENPDIFWEIVVK